MGRKECPACSGEGTVILWKTRRGIKVKAGTKKCDTCHGTGSVGTPGTIPPHERNK